MNKDLYALEEKIMRLLEKESNFGKQFSLLFIADMVDPHQKYDYKSFETIFEKLELDGTLYHNENDSWQLMAFLDDIIQGIVIKNEKGSCLVNMPDGRKFIFGEKDAGYLLNGDLVTFRATKNNSGSRCVCELDKIVKRKNGIIICSLESTMGGYALKPISTQLSYPIVLSDSDLISLNNFDQIVVQIDKLNDQGVFEAKFVKKVKSVSPSIEQEEATKDDSDTLEESEKKTKKKKKAKKPAIDLSTIDKSLRKVVNTEVYDNSELDTYLSNRTGIVNEQELADYTVTGKVSINRFGDATIDKNGTLYRVKRENLGDVLSGDTIEIRPTKRNGHGAINSVVEKIIKRKNGLVVVEISMDKKGKMALSPINAQFKHKLVFPKDFDKVLVAGERVLVKVDTQTKGMNYEVEFVKSIGHKDDPDIDIKSIAAEKEIVIDFTEEQMKEAYALPTKVLEEEKAGRDDYTEEKVFSIDGVNTKDRDDALSIKKLPNGNYSAGIHISDVTHYIKPGMALWDAIMQRGTSVYMDNTVIPQLPHIISNGICSLDPNKERLTLSCIVELTPEGEIVNFDFRDVVIKSRMAMTYDDVNKILEEDMVPQGYEDFVPELKILDKLAKKMAKRRKENGAVDFDDIESDIEVERDAKGNIVKFNANKNRSAEDLIKQFMLLAGECYADYMMIPTTYRVHEAPEEESVKDAMVKLHKLGVKVPGLHVNKDKKGKKVVSVRNVVNGNVLNKVIQSIKDTDLRTLAANIILCSMQRARIDAEAEIGHYALASPKVSRFTSPIRRAEDAIAHLQIRKQRDALYGADIGEDIKKDYKWIKEESAYITQKQLNAEEAEEAAIHLRMVQFTERNMDKEVFAHVTYANESGIFIKTDDGVVGKIDTHDYEDEQLIYDDNTMSYIGRTSGKRIKVGNVLKVIPLDTHREYQTINFGVPTTGKKLIKKRAA